MCRFNDGARVPSGLKTYLDTRFRKQNMVVSIQSECRLSGRRLSHPK